MVSPRKSSRLVSLLGTLGYLSVVLQWAWAAVLMSYVLLLEKDSSWMKIQPTNPTPTPDISFSLPPMAGIILTGLVTFVVIAGTLYTFFMLPKAVGKTGARVTRSTSNAITPIVTRHKPLAPKQRKQINYRVTIVLKFILVLFPFFASLIPQPHVPLDYRAIVVVATILASFSFVYFVLQYLAASLKKVDKRIIW